MDDLQLMVTLWPSFDHFPSLMDDERLHGIRLNRATASAPDLKEALATVGRLSIGGHGRPCWFDVKARQPRVETVSTRKDAHGKHLVLTLNHAIAVETPTPVLFKAGEDGALLDRLEDGGRTLVFRGGPSWDVRSGESLCIRHPSFRILDGFISDAELGRIAEVRAAGFSRWFLSYVESGRDVDRFLELVGRDAEVWLKIESPRGLRYVSKEFRKRDNLRLVAACGDLYVELEKPHHTLKAVERIIEADPEACAASRMMLSTGRADVPDLCDFAQLAWLHRIGYRMMMLCDDICLRERSLTTAVEAWMAFREDCVPAFGGKGKRSIWSLINPFSDEKNRIAR